LTKNLFENGLLKYLKPEQLDKIQSYKIGIAGAGGLGSNIAIILVRSGFCNFQIIDYDIISSDNLNRQYYFYDEIGKTKVETISKRMKKINPDIIIDTHCTKITTSNIHSFFQTSDIVFEAFDNALDKKILLEELSVYKNKVIILGNGLAGIKREPIAIRKIQHNIFVVGDGLTEVTSEYPPFAPRVIECSAIMANIAIERILT
jgi:sulfur carrier protein ThiS adenylyltransferase